MKFAAMDSNAAKMIDIKSIYSICMIKCEYS